MQLNQVRVFYSGVVQGVGFRYRTQCIALNMNINGWVRNLADGRVELLAQAPKKDLLELINRIDTHFEGYIKDKQVCWQNADDVKKGFNIAF